MYPSVRWPDVFVKIPKMDMFLHWGSPTLTLLTVLNIPNVPKVLDMPKDASLTCWALILLIIGGESEKIPSGAARADWHLISTGKSSSVRLSIGASVCLGSRDRKTLILVDIIDF